MLAFRLPDVGEGIDAAEIIEWHVSAGQAVREDQPLVDIQTDKAIVAIPCPTDGTVAELHAAVGETVAVGELLASFSTGAAAPPPPASGRAADEVGVATAPAVATAARQGPVARRPLASPATRRRARSLGIDLGTVSGSGPAGRITRDDVEAAASGPPAANAGGLAASHANGAAAPPGSERAAAPRGAATGPPASPGTPRASRTVPLQGTRRAIARTLTQQWQTIPHVIDYREVDVTALVAARAALKSAAGRAGDAELAKALTVSPLLIKIMAAALARHERANAAVDLGREEITLHGAVNVGLATAAPDGLVVPVLHDADRKSVHSIAREAAALGAAARERRLTPAQLAGGTATFNNYGGLGIWLGTPIIPPGQTVNLGVGRMEQRAVVRDGEIVVRPIVPLACSGDHRLLDGDTLAAFVSDVVALMEQPALLLGELA